MTNVRSAPGMVAGETDHCSMTRGNHVKEGFFLHFVAL